MKKRKISWPMRVFILFVVIVLTCIVGFLWWMDGTSPVDTSEQASVTFTVNRGESIRTIAGRLASERLIRSRTVFFLVVKMKGIDNSIQAGDFQLNRSMNAEGIADALTHGAVDIWVTTLEGWRNEEIGAKLSAELKIPEQEFIAEAQEGYMFPDTYLLPKNASASAVVAIFRANFDKRVTQELRNAAATEGLNLDQMVTLASIVEREGRTSEDRAVIAGILMNRLAKKMPLDVDASLQYIAGYSLAEKSWWKKALTDADKKIDSPYNTYKNVGLPPGPIANPGLSSVTAVAYPKKSDYIFYLHDPQGGIHYGKTLEEHEANIRKYLQ